MNQRYWIYQLTCPAVLRPGKITPAQIESVIGVPVDSEIHRVADNETPKAPGMKYRIMLLIRQFTWLHQRNWTQALFGCNLKLNSGLMLTNDLIKNIS